MNTISTTGQVLAMDGQRRLAAVAPVAAVRRRAASDMQDAAVAPSGADVAQKITQNLEDVKRSAEQMQKMYDMVVGHKLQFKVNEELKCVVINVVDPDTNKVLKEIPSEEIQTLKLRMKQTMGLLFDKLG